MGKSKLNVSALLLLVASLLSLGSIYIWAPVCKADHMSCVPTSHTIIILAFITLALAIQEFIIKKNKSYIIMFAIGIFILLVTYKNGLSKGFCPDPMMRCNKTDWWIKASALLVLAAGVLSAINTNKREIKK